MCGNPRRGMPLREALQFYFPRIDITERGATRIVSRCATSQKTGLAEEFGKAVSAISKLVVLHCYNYDCTCLEHLTSACGGSPRFIKPRIQQFEWLQSWLYARLDWKLNHSLSKCFPLFIIACSYTNIRNVGPFSSENLHAKCGNGRRETCMAFKAAYIHFPWESPWVELGWNLKWVHREVAHHKGLALQNHFSFILFHVTH